MPPRRQLSTARRNILARERNKEGRDHKTAVAERARDRAKQRRRDRRVHDQDTWTDAAILEQVRMDSLYGADAFVPHPPVFLPSAEPEAVSEWCPWLATWPFEPLSPTQRPRPPTEQAETKRADEAKQGGRDEETADEAKREGRDEETVRTCVVCMANPSSHAILPCMHMCLCLNCAGHVNRLKKCPKCRATIKSVKQVFL